MFPLFTIGHSNHSFEHFAALLGEHGVELIADVRSVPASARHPQFTRTALEPALAARGIRYLFLGRELGARRTEPEAWEGGVATYERIAQLRAFRDGLERVMAIVADCRAALMCAERVPLDCHRTLLVCRHLRDAIPGGIHHILADGSLESHTDLERRLVASLRTKQQQRDRSDAQPDLFNAETESPLDRAYRLRGHAIVYKGKSPPSLAGEGIVLVALPRRGGGNLERHTCVGEAP